MHLRRPTALLVALVAALPALSACSASGRDAATSQVNQIVMGTDNRDFEVDVLHGQMKASDKQRAMARFASGETQVLQQYLVRMFVTNTSAVSSSRPITATPWAFFRSMTTLLLPRFSDA